MILVAGANGYVGHPSSPGWRHSATTRSHAPSCQRHRGTPLCALIDEGRYSQVKDFTAITGREPESFRDFLLRATSGSPADGIVGSPFVSGTRSRIGILEYTIPRWLCVMIVIDHTWSWRRGDALHIAAIRRCLRYAIL